jgi:hypothetical protein
MKKTVATPKPKKLIDPNRKRQHRRPSDPEATSAEREAARESRKYFNKKTQYAIVAYQSCADRKERERLYVQEIFPAFDKLAENLINIYKFTGLHDSYQDLKCDCVNFLFETIGKFDANRGSNAFSYFNVVAKNWLIIRTKHKNLRLKRNVSLDDPTALNVNEQRIIEENSTLLPSQDAILQKLGIAKEIVALLKEIRNLVKTENELLCINSIITIFEKIDEIDLLSKSAILLYIRDMSGLTPKQLTSSMQTIKYHYKKLKVDSKFSIF